VSTSIGDQRILQGISLDVHRHVVTTIIGPSGSGKTTLLRTMNLLRTPDEGTIVFNGEVVFDAANNLTSSRRSARWLDLNPLSEMFGHGTLANGRYRRRFGMVFQDFNLWPNLTLYDNISAPLRWSLHLGETEIDDAVRQCASIVKISHLLRKFPHEASGGERQRAAIARALVTKPEILLLDEVTSALDVELAADILKLILLLKDSGHTMVLVTHHLGFAERISDEVLFLSKGKIAEVGGARDLFSHPRTAELTQFLEHLKL
jgi:polar amino acid transport system ATP-binding protein